MDTQQHLCACYVAVMQVALPGVLNSAGKIFTFAALLKILVIAHGAVPWLGE